MFTGKVREPHEPTQVFIALRAALLGVDDLARQAVRKWFDQCTSAYSGEVNDGVGETEGTVLFFRVSYGCLEPNERLLWRQWLMHWTEYTGRIITPGEHAARAAKHREEYRRLEMQKAPPSTPSGAKSGAL